MVSARRKRTEIESLGLIKVDGMLLPKQTRTEQRRAAQRERLAEIGIDLQEKSKTGRNKFHNVTAVYNGEKYDSSGEAEYAASLDTKMRAGKIVDWSRPPAMVIDDRCLTCDALGWNTPCLDAKGRPMRSLHRERLTYKPDFYIVPPVPANSYYVDYKGSEITETPLWRRKMIQWRKNVPFELRVVYKDGTEKVVCTGDEAVRFKLGETDDPAAV